MNIADINTFTRFLVSADTSSYTAANLLITTNNAYRNVVSRIIRGDRTWEFDDLNYTTFPIYTDDLVAAQSDYALDKNFLNILKVHVMNSNGDYEELTPLDLAQLTTPVDELFETDGKPIYYDARYGSLWLYPAPASGDVTTSSGLRIYAQRGADEFTSGQVTTGTKEPGFAINHEVLSYLAALPFAQKYRRNQVPFLMSEARKLADEILEHHAQRERGKRSRMHFRSVDSV